MTQKRVSNRSKNPMRWAWVCFAIAILALVSAMGLVIFGIE
jgi:hypothetical protein